MASDSTQSDRVKLDSVTIRFAGDSGDGMQLTGSRFTQESARLGNDLATLPDYPAEIRAPICTIGGISSFQINIGSGEVHTAGDIPFVLVAMNPAALAKYIGDLKQNGILICNSDAFHEKNLARAGYESNPLEDPELQTKFNLISVPMSTLTQEAVKDLDLPKQTAERCKNFFALGVVSWLFSREIDETVNWIGDKFRKEPKIVLANQAALRAGVAYAEASEFFTSHYEVPRAELKPGVYRNITGNQAVAYGFVAASHLSEIPLVFAGYPITPASEIIQELSKFKNFGVVTYQCEDEIAAACAAIGASFGGRLGVTASSGPGIALKQEALGLAVMTELPLVVVNVQRGGPSTGMPTKTEQADLLQAIFGRNGECPMVVVAISSPADAFDVTYKACKIAIEYMTPVMVLSDGCIANGSQPWLLPHFDEMEMINAPFVAEGDQEGFKPYKRNSETLARSWAVPGMTGFEHIIGGLEKKDGEGTISYEPENHEKMVALRKAKVEGVAKTFPATEVVGEAKGDLLVISWGGTYGAALSAVKQAQEEGHSVSLINLKFLYPLPLDLGDIIKNFRRILIPEQNLGQLRLFLQSKYLIEMEGLHKVQGQPFKQWEIYEKLKEMFNV